MRMSIWAVKLSTFLTNEILLKVESSQSESEEIYGQRSSQFE